MNMLRRNRIVLIAAGVLLAVFFAKTGFANVLDEGKQLLLKDMDIVAAHAKFDLAINDPACDKQAAYFWHAVSTISGNEVLKSKLRELRILGTDNKLAVVDAVYEPNYNIEADVDNIIADDGEAIFSDGANWNTLQASDVRLAYNDSCRSHIAGIGLNTATWTPAVAVAGSYNVYVWTTGSGLNAPNAEYTVTYQGGSRTVHVDQRAWGWRSLGKYYFPVGNFNSIILSDKSSMGRVVADAIKLEYNGFIVDNSDPEFHTSDSWQVGAANRGYNDSYVWQYAIDGSSATWTLNVPDAPKDYLIFAKWPRIEEGLSSSAKYTVTPYGGTPKTVTINQTDPAGSYWRCLGTFHFTSASGNTVRLDSTQSGKVVADVIKAVPCRPYPDLTQAQNILSGQSGVTGILTEIDAALADLSNVTDTFTDMVVSYNPKVMSNDTALDYGDAAMLKALLYTLKMELKIHAASEMDNTNIQPFAFGGSLDAMRTMLNDYINLFKPRAGLTEGAIRAIMGEAKDSLVSGIDAYTIGSAFIRARSDNDGLNHLVSFWDKYPIRTDYSSDETFQNAILEWQSDKDQTLTQEEFIRGKLDEVKGNLTDYSNHPFVTIPAYFSEDEVGPGIDLNVDLYEFFMNPKDIRSYIDQLINSDLLTDDFSNSTLGDVLPGFTPTDWNFLLGVGPYFTDDPVIAWNNDTPEVSLKWDASKDAHYDNIARYEIWRVPSLGATRHSVGAELVRTINDNSVSSYTDSSLDASADSCYYRIYTYYSGLNGTGTAETYTRTAQAIFRVYVDQASGVQSEDGTKASPYKDLGDGTRYAGAGTKVCVAKGTYQECDGTLQVWGKPGMIFEGGYAPGTWERNIAANETIIDSNGLSPWSSTFSFWNLNNMTVDGFTVVGQISTNSWNSSINIGSSSGTVIKNCTIRGSNSGIQVDSSPNTLIKDCLIVGSGPTIQNSNAGINIYSQQQASSVTITGCHITNWSGRGIVFNSTDGLQASLTVFNNIIDKNYGTGIACWGNNTNDVSIQNNTIAGNKVGEGGIYYSGLRSFVIKNNVVAGNNGGSDIGIFGDNVVSQSRVMANNDSYGNAYKNYYNCGIDAGQGGNISLDPLFLDAANGNYRLSQTASGQGSDSPVVNAGSDTALSLGLDGMTTRTDNVADSGIVDMGYHYPVPPAPINTVTIRGRVTDKAASLNLANVPISFYDTVARTNKYTTTDANGGYVFTGLSKGNGRITAMPNSTYAWHGIEKIFDVDSTVDFKLPYESTATGVVKDRESGDLIPQIMNIHYENHTQEAYRTFQTNGSGAFSLTGLPEGIASLMTEPDVATGYAWLHKYIYLAEAEHGFGWEMPLQKGALITGSVVNPSRDKLPGVFLYLKGSGGEQWWGKTDENGNFAIRLPGDATKIYCLNLSSGNVSTGLLAIPMEFTVTGPNDNKTIELMVYSSSDQSHITGVVANPQGYPKTSAFMIAAFEAGKVCDRETMKYLNPVVTAMADDATGAYDLSVPQGPDYDLYMVVVDGSGGGRQSFTLRQKLYNVVLTTVGNNFSYTSVGGTVSGTVKKGDKAILMAKVFLEDANKNLSAYAYTDQNGVYSMYNVPAGNYKISAWQGDIGQSSDFTVSNVADGGVVSVNISFNQKPEVGTIVPDSGASDPNKAVDFTTTFVDGNGWQDVQCAYFLMNTYVSGSNAAFVYYNQNTNKLYVRNDAGTNALGGYAPGSNKVIENSFVKLDCSKTTVSGNGNTLTIKWNLTFKSSFSGPRKGYLLAVDYSNASTGWVQKGTWSITNQAPSVGTITPSSGSSLPNEEVKFTTTSSDPDGWQNLQYVFFIVNSRIDGSNSFCGYYNQDLNKLYLRDETGNTWMGGFTPGSINVIENSYAKLDCSKTTISGSGTTLTINWSVTFKAPFAGQRNMYLYARDDANAYDGWTQKGTWSLPNQAPSTGTVTPSSGFTYPNQACQFVTTSSDADGWQNLQYIFLLINSKVDGSKSFYGYYNQDSNKLYLRDDSGTTWMGGFVPGSSNVIENSYVKLDCSQTTVSGSGPAVTINWAITFKSTFTGQKKIYAYVKDDAGASEGWTLKGSRTIQP